MQFTISKRLFGQVVRTAHAFSDSAETRRKINQGYDVSPFRYPVTLAATPLGLEISAYDGAAILTQRVPAGVADAGSVSLDILALRSALARPKARDIVTFEAHSNPSDAAITASRLLDGDKATALEGVHSGCHHDPAAQLGEHLITRLEFPATQLAAIIDETAFAASTDPSRPYLNGLFIEAQNGRLRIVATDGWRLAIRDTSIPLDELALPDDGFNGRGAILPLKSMRALQPLLKDGGSAIMEIWSGGARFHCKAGHVVTQFVDGSFPAYRRVTPAGRMESAPLELSTLADAVKAARSGARSATRWPKVTLNGHVTLTDYRDPWRHDGEETLLPIECHVEGAPIAFNGWHLEDAGRAFGRVRMAMRYSKPDHPAVFVSPDRPELVVVQMPTRA